MTNNIKQRKSVSVLAGLGALVVLEVLASWMIVAVYVQRDDSAIVKRTAGFLPIAKVGLISINYGQFTFTRDAIKHFLNSPTVQSAGQAQPMTPVIEKSAYERLLREAAVKELAAQKNVQVTDEDLKNAYTDFLTQASSTVPNVPQYIKDTFGWTEQQYQANIIRPQLLEDKLIATYATDTDQATQFEAYLTDRLQKSDVKRYLDFPTE